MTDERVLGAQNITESVDGLMPIDRIVNSFVKALEDRELDDDVPIDTLMDCLRLREQGYRLAQLRAIYRIEYKHTVRKEDLFTLESDIRVAEAEYGTTRALIGDKKDGNLHYQDQFGMWRNMFHSAEAELGQEAQSQLYSHLRARFNLTEPNLD